MIPKLFTARISAKLTLTTLVFILAMAIAITALIVYSFQQTRIRAVRRSVDALEAQASAALLNQAQTEAEVTAAQLKQAEQVTQTAASFLVQMFSLGAQPPSDTLELSPDPSGIYYDANPNRRSELLAASRFQNSESARRDLRASAFLEGLFPVLQEQNPDVIAIYYISPNQFLRYFPVVNLVSQLYNVSGNQTTALRMADPQANPERRTIWTLPYLDNAGQGLLLTIISPVYEGDEFRGVIAADVSLESMVAELNNLRPVASGYAILVNGEGDLVAAPQSAQVEIFTSDQLAQEPAPGVPLGLDLSSSPYDGMAAIAEHMRQGVNGVQRIDLKSGAVFLAYAPLADIGWSLGLIAPLSEITAQADAVAASIGNDAQTAVRFTLLVMGVVFFLALAGTYSLSHQLIIQPIQTLVNAVRAISGGDLNIQIPVASRDEIGLLAAAFNNMTHDLRKQNEELASTNASLAEREAQYRSIFESVRDGLFINDLSGKLVDFNPAAHLMHGYSQEEFAQLQPRQFIHPDSWHVFEEYVQAMRVGERFRGRSMDIRKDGSIIHVDITASSFIYRGQPHSLGVVRDVTQEVQAFQILEQRVQARTRELSTLLKVSQDVASTLELEPLLALILDQLKVVVDYAMAAVLIFNEKGELTLIDQRGGIDLKDGRLSLRLGTYDLESMGLAQPFIVPDTKSDTPQAAAWRAAALQNWNGRPEELSVINSWMSIPLTLKERPIGLLVLEHEEVNHYSSQHAELAMAFANQAAIAIENARLYEQAKVLASLQERQKLARELHDSVSQALYGIGLGARTARTLMDRDPARAIEPLEYVLTLAEAGLAEMRALIFELRPESLEVEGLVAALTRHSAALRARHQIAVETDFCDEPALPLDTKQGMYRVAQEAMHNIVKHAQASKVMLRLCKDGGSVLLEVEDDGQGFDTSGSFPGHLGLKSMRERVEKLGGAFSIDSGPGQGTRIQVRIPTA